MLRSLRIFRLIFLEDARQKRSEYAIFTSILTKQIQENHPENDKVYQYICFPPLAVSHTASGYPLRVRFVHSEKFFLFPLYVEKMQTIKSAFCIE